MEKAIAGDTENGKSISVTRMLLPRKLYLLTHQAALTPKTTLSGTEITTAKMVSLRADSASPLLNRNRREDIRVK